MASPSASSGTFAYYDDNGKPFIDIYDSGKTYGQYSYYDDNGKPYITVWETGTPPASTPAPFLLLLGVGS